LWENEENDGEKFKPQTFVDLGCGNGLLVHILNNEGVSKSFLANAQYF
jgi:tRNASer (uridine44-2'-O)-methyltransferase